MFHAVIRRRVLQSTVSTTVKSVRVSPLLARWYASFPAHQVIKMPALSPTMTTGNIGAWQKKPGDSIAPGDVLVEVETDKAQMDFEFQEEGVIAKILKEAGEKDVAVGSPIAILVDEGTDVSAFESFTLADAGGDTAAPAPAKEEKTEAAAPEPAPPVSAAPVQTVEEVPAGKLENALDRVLKKPKEEAAPAAAAGAAGAAAPTYQDIELTNMRKTIARRLQESTQQNPHFYVTSRLSVTKLLKLRAALNASADGKYKLSVNDFLVKAIAVASKKVPAANASWQGDFIRQYDNVDVSVAVSTPTGLITPIVTNVEGRGLESISNSVKELAKLARDGKLKPEQYQGGTISISNLGMNDSVDHFTAVVNPPQATILAIGTSKKVAIPVETPEGTSVEWDDQITVTASFDHKVVDGAVGAEWVKALKKVIENPLELLL